MSLNRPYERISELPEIIPVFPLEGILLLPGAELPLNIFEPRYLEMVDVALGTHRLIGMIQPTPDPETKGGATNLESVGCLGRITQISESGDGRYSLTLTGISRFRTIQEINVESPFRQMRVSFAEFASDLAEVDIDAIAVRSELTRMLKMFEQTRGLKIDWRSISDTRDDVVINALAMTMQFAQSEKQALLEADSIKSRADILTAIAEQEMAAQAGATTRLQ